MDRSKIIERMKSKTTTIDQFNYDALSAPPLLSLLTYEDIEYFRRLATSIKYSAKIDYKYAEIDKVMKMRGFVKLGGGTNRVVYRHLELDTIVVKIAIDAVGIKDNPREYENQFYLKPYVTKVFEVSPCGTVGLFERCDQITSREEFESIASEVFDLLSNWIIGKYIMEDIGSEYFMNYCVRPGFGPVLCDFPYLYELDGNKLYCQIPDDNGFLCDGLIDYDEGFNHLYCSKCGAKYKAIELKKAIDNKLIISKEKENVKMRIVTKLGNKVLSVKDTTKETKKFEGRREKKYKKLKANNPVDSIRITTTKQKEEEKVVTKVEDCVVVNQMCTEIPENNITQCNDVKEEPKVEEFLDKEETEYEIDCIGKPVEVDYFECIKDYKDSDGDSTTVFYRDYHGTDEGTIDDIVDIYFERWCDIKDEITHNDEDTYNLTISTEIAVYDEYFKQELSDTADMHGEDCLLVEGGENYNLSKEDYENVYKIVEDVRDDILNYINNDEFIIEISIKINSKSYNKLDLGEDVDEVKDICVNTIDYIQESILEKHGYDNMNIRIELTISEEIYDVDKFKAIYVNSDIDDNEEDVEEVKEDNTVEEIQNQESEVVEEPELAEESQEAIEFESDGSEEVVQEEEPEDAYENEQEDDNVVEETPDYSSSFIPAPKELPVGSTQVNNSYYNNNKKKNKHR